MRKKTKDSASSWEQRSWQFAVERYDRLTRMLKISSNPANLKYCTEGLAQLEQQYPQLKGRSSHAAS